MLDIIKIFIPGRPRTKGSLRAETNIGTGRTRMVEQVAESVVWRRMVSNEVIKNITTEIGSRRRLLRGFPLDVACEVYCDFFFPRERGDDADFPVAIRYGDTDKLLRNVLDALKDARLYTDDRLVQRAWGDKWFASDEVFGGVPGLALRVRKSVGITPILPPWGASDD